MKFFRSAVPARAPRSPPVWGAWVEMSMVMAYRPFLPVAPRVGGVG